MVVPVCSRGGMWRLRRALLLTVIGSEPAPVAHIGLPMSVFRAACSRLRALYVRRGDAYEHVA